MAEVTDESPPVAATEELYRREASRLYRSLVGAFGRSEIADEAVAEAFVQLLRRGDAVRDPRAWVWRTAFAVARGLVADRADAEPGAMPELPWEDAAAPVDLLRALAALSPKLREAVVLRHWAGFSAVEIGRITGADAATVRVRVLRAKRQLRAALGER
ncbi:MAG: sigma-70 family RNA polymerase sigma factor [Actinomycetota bacterium]